MGGDTKNCENCGDEGIENNPNPIDSCGRENLGCDNPCGHGPHNSAKCESLPSQIQNFTDQFFGEVVKTEINGAVVWSLPCSLDIGLPANPRGVSEGLACYFLRLFNDGIIGLTGPQGNPGAAGAAGINSYSVTLHSFQQPTLANPNVQVLTAFNPAVSLDGLYLFIDTSGWYVLNGSDNNGTLFLTLLRSVAGASGLIQPGKLVIVSGTPGVSITGPAGPQGPQGQTGSPGASFTATNGEYFATVGTDYPVPVSFTAVTFVNSSPQFLAPAAGKYLVNVAAEFEGQAPIISTDFVALKLVNLSTSGDVPGSLFSSNNIAVGEDRLMSISVIATTDAANQTIALFAECTTAGHAVLRALRTTITWVRLA